MSPRVRSLVGREIEVAMLDHALDEIDAGRATALAVDGEPGIGKSALLADLRVRSEDRGHVVLHGAGSEFERYVPFGLLVEAFDPFLASHADELTGLPGALLAELGAIFPSMRTESSSTTPATADERYRAHRAVRSLLERLAERNPVTVIVDDAHWADDASLEVVQTLLRKPPDAAVLLAVGFRPGQAPTRLAAALAAPDLARISLGPLSRDEAASLLGIDPGSPELTAIYDEGVGNPFYLEQLARTGGGRQLHAHATRPRVAGGVPDGIAASVAAELASMPAVARTMLEAAAIVGDPFEPDLAADVAGLTLDDGLDRLDELLALDVIRPTDVPRRFTFRHPLLRRAVYEGANGGWRLAAHQRAAVALAARGAPATARAHHVEFAARQGDPAAIEVLLEAADASAVRAPVVAARWYEAALRLLPGTDLDGQIDVRRRLANVTKASGRLEPCRAVLLEAIDLITDPSDPTLVELTTQCAAVERWLGQDGAAQARLARAWDRLPDRASAAGALLQIEIAVEGVFDRDLDRAIEMAAGALATAREIGDPSLIGAASAALALAEVGAGHIDAARSHRAEAARILDGLADAELTVRLDALYHLAWAENYLEHFDDAIAHVERLIDIVRRANGARPLVPMMLVTCYPLENLGRLAEAARQCDAAVEATRLDGGEHFLPWALFERAWVHYYMGELDAAIACASESIRISHRQIGGAGPSAGIGPVWIEACALIESGSPERAVELLGPHVGDDIDGALPVERGFFWETLVLAALGVGDRAQAASYVARSEADADSTGLAIPRGVALRARAELLLADGDAAGAAVSAAASVGAFASIRARMEVAFSRSLQGRALAEAGDRDAAVAALQEAEAELDACGSLRERDGARRELRKLGARVEVRGPDTAADSGIESLTEREREIADLVTDRHTNREIAGRLYLSQKTIETHLRNIFVKLGASSRVEVARMIERHRQQPV